MKNFLLLIVILTSITVFSQSIENKYLIYTLDNDIIYYRKILNEYESAKNTARQENKLFIYTDGSINVEKYIFRPYYDSLVLKKTGDSTLLRKSFFYIKKDNIKYFLTLTNDCANSYYAFKGYKDNKLVITFLWSTDYFTKEDLVKKEAFHYTFKRSANSAPIYVYNKYDKVLNDKLYDLVYSKFIDENGISKEKFYKKDFPLSEGEIFKMLPKKIANQAVALMKEKYFERYTLVWDKEGNIVDAQRVENEKINPFNQDDAKLAAKVFEMKLKNEKHEIRIDRVYIDNDSTPLYHIRFNPYTLVVNPKTGDIIKMDYKQNIE
ncbi:hypothetical protein [uncultured Chryseobacterium sp.]|uniref:hypothetical protein n=1 Tax=uncultured Chryseobacterium sp. TaxID=259322 RepID=UPI0025E7C146|nr:hypothetical protein [uncultured Chryseobacterium sp.]